MSSNITAMPSEGREQPDSQDLNAVTPLKQQPDETYYDWCWRRALDMRKEKQSKAVIKKASILPPVSTANPQAASKVFRIPEFVALILEHYDFDDAIHLTRLRQVNRTLCSLVDHRHADKRFLRGVTPSRYLAWNDYDKSRWHEVRGLPRVLYIWNSELPPLWELESQVHPTKILLFKFHPLLAAEQVVGVGEHAVFLPPELSSLPVARDYESVKILGPTVKESTFMSSVWRCSVFRFEAASIPALSSESHCELQSTLATQPPMSFSQLMGYSKRKSGKSVPEVFRCLERKTGVTLGDLQQLIHSTVTKRPIKFWTVRLNNCLLDDS